MTDHIKLLGLMLNIMAGVLLLAYLNRQRKQTGEGVFPVLIAYSAAVVLGVTVFYVALYLNINIPRFFESVPSSLPDTLFILLAYTIIISTSYAVITLYYRFLKIAVPPWARRAGLILVAVILIHLILHAALEPEAAVYRPVDFIVENVALVFIVVEITYLLRLLVRSRKLASPEYRKAGLALALLFSGRYVLLPVFTFLVPSLIRGFLFFIYWHGSCFFWVRSFYLPYLITAKAAGNHRETASQMAGRFSLSKREEEILRLMLSGKNNREIEDELYISYNTVKNHIHAIYGKIGIGNRFQLFKLAEEYK